MPGEDIDHATFGVDRERDLGLDHPCRQVVAEHPSDLLMQRGVPGIQEPVEIARAPARDQVDPDVEGGRDSPHDLEGESVHVPSLDPRDGRRGDACRSSKVGLAPMAANSDGANGGAQALIVHGDSVATRTYSGVIEPLSVRSSTGGRRGHDDQPAPSLGAAKGQTGRADSRA